jgi:hypothetical protein
VCVVLEAWCELRKKCSLSKPPDPTIGGRSAGFLRRHSLMASTAPPSTQSGKRMTWFGLTIACSFWIMWSSANGVLPNKERTNRRCVRLSCKSSHSLRIVDLTYRKPSGRGCSLATKCQMPVERRRVVKLEKGKENKYRLGQDNVPFQSSS